MTIRTAGRDRVGEHQGRRVDLWRALSAAVVLAATSVPLTILPSASAMAATGYLPTFEYVNENPNWSNYVDAFEVTGSGGESLVGRYATEGIGSDSSFVSSGRVEVDVAQTSGHLYALNLGDSPETI